MFSNFNFKEKPAFAPWIVALVLFAVATLLTYRFVAFHGNTVITGGYDVYRSAGPLSFYYDFMLQRGEFPLWNPLSMCGMPFAANPVACVFYPFNFLRSILTLDPTPLKTQIGWIIMMFLHILIAGAGAMALGRHHKFSWPASFTVAVALLFSAIWTRRICEYHFLILTAWTPWLLLIALKAALAPALQQKLRWSLVGALVMGVALLSGAANIAPYLGLMLGFVAVMTVFVEAREVRVRPILRDVFLQCVFLGIVVLVGGLIAAALYVPGQQFAALSARVDSSSVDFLNPGYQKSPWQLFQDLVRFPGLRFEPEDIRGAGIGVMLLALMAFASGRWRLLTLYGLLFLLLFDCSMGRPWPVASMVDMLSPIRMIASTRAFDFAMLPLAMLAGLGLDTAVQRFAGWRPFLVRRAVEVLAVVALVTLARQLGPESYLAMSYVALAIPIVTLVAVTLARHLPHPRAWAVALAALIFLETFTWNSRYIPAIITDKEGLPGVPEMEPLFWLDNERGTFLPMNRHLYEMRPIMNGYEPVHLAKVREVIGSDARLKSYQRGISPSEVTGANFRGHLFLKRAFWLTREYVDGPLPSRHGLYPPTTTVFLQDPGELPVPKIGMEELSPQPISGHTTIHHTVSPKQLQEINKALKPGLEARTFTLPTVSIPAKHCALRLVIQSTADIASRMTFINKDTGHTELGKSRKLTGRPTPYTVQIPLPDFDRLDVNLQFNVPADVEVVMKSVQVVIDDSDETALIKLRTRSANSVDLRVGPLSAPRILLFTDAYFPGWKAFVNDLEVPILVANEAFKAIVLPEGQHHVVFVFRPTRLYAGVAISLTTVLLTVALLYFLRRESWNNSAN